MTETTDLTRALVAAATAFLDELNAGPHASLSDLRLQPGQTFDPLVDSPPVSPRHDTHGPESDWAYLLFIGSIWMLNESKGRAVRPDEISPIAKRAGYSDGRAVSGYLNGTEPAMRRDSHGYRVTRNGRRWLRELCKKLDVKLPNEPDDKPDDGRDD